MKYLSIEKDVHIGENVKLAEFINLYGCFIDDNTRIGAFVEIQKNARVGKNCKISSHTFICEGVTIEDGVFVGHNVTFINDKFPRATNQDRRVKDRSRLEGGAYACKERRLDRFGRDDTRQSGHRRERYCRSRQHRYQRRPALFHSGR